MINECSSTTEYWSSVIRECLYEWVKIGKIIVVSLASLHRTILLYFIFTLLYEDELSTKLSAEDDDFLQRLTTLIYQDGRNKELSKSELVRLFVTVSLSGIRKELPLLLKQLSPLQSRLFCSNHFINTTILFKCIYYSIDLGRIIFC